MNKRYLEDLSIGEQRESSPLTVELEPMLEFARRYDPQYFHTDTDAARGSVFGEVIASGIYTMALWRQLDHQISHDIAWICGVACDDVRFPRAVRAGDRLRARSECLSTRPSASQPGRGIAVFRYQLLNQHDQVVFDCRSTNLVQSRADSVTARTA